MPSTSQVANLIQQVYRQTKADVAGYKVKAHSDTSYFYQNERGDSIFAIRGMKFESPDLHAVSTIIANALKSTPRYQRDLTFVTKNLKHTQEGKTLFIGHSLGGAIIDQMLQDGIAHKAITLNPAVMPKDLRNSGNERYYNPNDFLYLLIGRYASHIHVTGSRFDFAFATANAQLPSLFSFWTHHALSKFIKDYVPRLPFQQEEKKGDDYVVQSVVLNKSAFENRTRATEWILKHKYKVGHVDETHDEYRYRQVSPEVSRVGHEARNISLGQVGHLVVLYS